VLVLPLVPPVAALLTAGVVVAVAVVGSLVVAVGVAGAHEFEALKGGLDLLPVPPAARLAPARLGAEQLRDPPGAFLPEGRPLREPAGPLTPWVPPARPAPPDLVPHVGLVAGGGPHRGRPARPVDRGRQAVASRPGALPPAMLRWRLVVQAVGAPVAVQCHRGREPGSLLGGPLRSWHGAKRLDQPARLGQHHGALVDPLPPGQLPGVGPLLQRQVVMLFQPAGPLLLCPPQHSDPLAGVLGLPAHRLQSMLGEGDPVAGDGLLSPMQQPPPGGGQRSRRRLVFCLGSPACLLQVDGPLPGPLELS
jgi:hypothetical protein